MKTHKIIQELESAIQQLGFEVRKERGNFRGGRCIVEGQEFIMLNRHHVPEVHLAVLAESLRDVPVDKIYLKPAVRKALEEAWDARGSVEVENVNAE